MLAIRNLLPFFALVLSGCIPYAPSTTDWHKTPKIVLQVCSTAPDTKSAEIILFRSSGHLSLRSGSMPPRGKTLASQKVFESIWEYPRSFHEAIGVKIEAEGNNEFFLFAIPNRYTEDWSLWVVPSAVEHEQPKDINNFRYKPKRSTLSAEVTKKAPRLRYRLEYQIRYSKNRLLPERYEGMPSCS